MVGLAVLRASSRDVAISMTGVTQETLEGEDEGTELGLFVVTEDEQEDESTEGDAGTVCFLMTASL